MNKCVYLCTVCLSAALPARASVQVNCLFCCFSLHSYRHARTHTRSSAQHASSRAHTHTHWSNSDTHTVQNSVNFRSTKLKKKKKKHKKATQTILACAHELRVVVGVAITCRRCHHRCFFLSSLCFMILSVCLKSHSAAQQYLCRV